MKWAISQTGRNIYQQTSKLISIASPFLNAEKLQKILSIWLKRPL